MTPPPPPFTPTQSQSSFTNLVLHQSRAQRFEIIHFQHRKCLNFTSIFTFKPKLAKFERVAGQIQSHVKHARWGDIKRYREIQKTSIVRANIFLCLVMPSKTEGILVLKAVIS